ncbi:SGNH/GDSL hydrolase family protein [Candidatus Nitrotoga sp. 1052]|uniref:SGNH/GDSL hydrolase family protein n=1 Tax=Candidatus Nitrotoga sp. 1052 TaxID=2886964 RepID=UPI001EF6F937|nr:SGNH/GDSL hydrolase family protein [Candidatus Nitrotoga sp. 1052]CAH1081227.1 conserved hypothetical protein [Candidatus Nitrotoga sp. 1052]
MEKKLKNKAIQAGEEIAAMVLKSRAKALKKRKSALQKVNKLPLHAPAPILKTSYMRLLSGVTQNKGVLVAEGDSWFDYPWNDVLSCLEDEHGYDVESVAHKGDCVEDMAYSGGQLVELSRRIEKLLRQGALPKAILLSGGGNDIAGDEFGMLLNHKLSPIAGFNTNVVEGVMERISHAYVTIIAAVTKLCQESTGVQIPIMVHGYDYPVPDGRGFMGGWAFLPGPWLEPGFRNKGFDNLQERTGMMVNLIDRFNLMLQEVAKQPEFAKHVVYVDLRNTLRNKTVTYKKDWANELHPSEDGFSSISNKFAILLDELP